MMFGYYTLSGLTVDNRWYAIRKKSSQCILCTNISYTDLNLMILFGCPPIDFSKLILYVISLFQI